MVWAENSRAFSSRTSDRPVLENIFSNMAMQKAITLAQIALYLITFLPGLSYPIFELQGALILDWGFWVGIAIAFLCILMCEVYKFVCREQIKNFRERVQKQQDQEEQERLAKFSPLSSEPEKESETEKKFYEDVGLGQPHGYRRLQQENILACAFKTRGMLAEDEGLLDTRLLGRP